ncbi:TPA: coagulase [Staphylococcus aureus]|nr:coagulase [Staphylococcus aureus]
MKNKLLVLSLGALCVSQIWESNHASAVVSGEKNPYVSKALELKDKSNKSNSYENYRDSLESLISSLSFADYEKYEEPEYEKAVKKYQQKFMAEDDALKNFLNEEKKIKNADISRKSNDLLGLTHERYSYIFDTLKKNKQEFLKDIEEIQLKNSDLKDFNNTEQHNADVEINNLENKVLMVGYTFYNTNKDEVEELYSELDLIVGEVQDKSDKKRAVNQRKSEALKERFINRQKSKNESVVSLIDDEDDNENDKKLVVSAPTKKPTSPTTYTETTTQVPMPTVERQTQQQIIYNAPKQLAGLNGESHDFTTTHQSPTTSNHTHNNVVEFEETSALPGRKSGSLVGISQIDSSHLTEREKRVIKREHVREAQKLVDNYKDTHSYKDRLNAQQKVNTLSESHQKRFNKQINKVYNGK